MNSLHYSSLPDSQGKLSTFFKGKKVWSALVMVFSVSAVALVLATVSFAGGKNEALVENDSNLKSSGGNLAAKPSSFNLKIVNSPPSEKSGASSENVNKTSAPYNFVQWTSPPLIVRTAQGCVKGTTLESRAGREYLGFYNIPYAKPPLGPLRFKPPEPPLPWKGLRDGTQIGPECIQKEKYAPVPRSAGAEDCLFLNVFTPQLPTHVDTDPCSDDPEDIVKINPNYPVMVYIHGGGLNSGNGSRYGADYFMDEDVILITFEFRVGAFGFISTGDSEITGNMGMKDVIMALKWVQKNIAAFGGDPKRVTVFGNSSGSMTVHALLLSNMSKGLFHGAISQSGTAIMEGGGILPFSPLHIVTNLAVEVGCNGSNATTKEMVDCLREVDAEELAIIESPFVVFAPTVEATPADGDVSNVFYERPPVEIMLDTENYPMKGIPWIVGDNSGEALLTTLQDLKNPELIRDLNENWLERLPKQLSFKHRPSDEKLNSIKEFYFGRHIKRDVGNHTRFELLNMYSDHMYVQATKMAATAHAQHSPVFLYWLTKEAAKGYADDYKGGFTAPFGVSHAEELQYFFLYDGYPEIPIGSTYARFSQKLVHNWAAFATTGSPALEDWLPIELAKNGTVWYRLDDDDKTGPTHMLRRRVNFWEDFTYELYG